MNLFREILARFPHKGLVYSFAYGSGVKRQSGYEAEEQKNNIIDLIFCVTDSHEWHALNQEKHPSHYSGLQLLGSKFIAGYQDRLSAGVYFNTLVPLSDIGVTIKYGVVSKQKLLQDLIDWDYLYLAGRLQKPVLNIVSASSEDLNKALQRNLLNAFQMALLLLPERFSDFELFHTICNLSYRGDFRMIFGENKNKVRNIVQAQSKDFFQLYRPAIQQLSDYIAVDFDAKELGSGRPIIQFEQDKSVAANEFHLRSAPAKLRARLIKNSAYRGSYVDIVEHIANGHNLREIVEASVNDIVWWSSITQSVKNIPAAGLLKSAVYSYRKATKTFAK